MPRAPRFDRQVSLDKAVELFWSRGYHASSMKHIEQALDMRPGSLYATFGNKSGLFAEALDTYAGRMGNELRQIMERSNGIVDGLKNYLLSFAQPCQQDRPAPTQACMLVKTLLEVNQEDEALQAKVNAMLAAIEAGLSATLEQAKAAGELRPDVDCPRLARLLQAQIMGLRTFAERKLPQPQIEALADDMAGLLDAYRPL